MEMQIAYVAALARLAGILGASVVRIFTAYEGNGLPPTTVWNRVVTASRNVAIAPASMA